MKLSIIISVYNLKDYIRNCIKSILDQKVSTDLYEIILVDDGSTDGSFFMLENFEKKYTNIKLLKKENGGASSARNLGLKYATGDYIWFVDGDDAIVENSLVKIFDNINTTPDLLFINYFTCTETYEIRSSSQFYLPGIISGEKFFKGRCGDFIMPWRYIIRKNLLLEHNLQFIEGITFEDDEWAPRLLYYAQKCIILKDPLYFYVRRSTSLMASFNVKKIPSFHTVVKSLMTFRDRLSDNDSFKYLLNEYIITYVSNYLRYRKVRKISGKDDLVKINKNVIFLYKRLSYKKKIQAFLIKHIPYCYSILCAVK